MSYYQFIAITKHGHKELVAVENAYRESEAKYIELLNPCVKSGATPCFNRISYA
ncbi:MAG: hypothetical protein ACEY3J_03165 [Arsenophonus sp.]